MKSYVMRAAFVIAAVALLAIPLSGGAASQNPYQIAPQFQATYDAGGGLRIFGYPASDPTTVNGLLVQYFERARFEYHPELAGTPYEVQLARVGSDDADSRGLLDTPPFRTLPAGGSDGNCVFFSETGHRLCSGFREFWQNHGLDLGDPGVSIRESLALFGYPISEEFTDPSSGLTVQYFERARFEYHPEFAGTQNAVMLGLLGNAQYERFSFGSGRWKKSTPTPTPTTTSTPTPTPSPTPSPTPTATSTPSTTQSSTPATSIQSMVNAAASGATVYVPAGIYRETVTITKPITLIGQPGAEIRGSDVWNSGWTQSGSYWLRGTVPSFPTGTLPCDGSSNGRCAWPEQVFFDGNPLYQVASNPTTGQFAVNSARQIVLADNPSGHIAEVTTRQYWIIGQSDNVTIQGFTMKHAAVPGQQGALSNNWYSHWVIQNNTLSDANGAAVSLSHGSDIKLLNNNISRNGELGVFGWQSTNVLIQGNRLFGNNTEAFNPGYEAGGLKIGNVQQVQITQNEVYGNYGMGLWCDVDCEYVTISGNRVHDNQNQGITYEISGHGTITGNSVWNNGFGNQIWGWGAGIMLQNSHDSEVGNNVVAWNADGIAVISQDRGSIYNNVSNNYVHDNSILMTSAQQPDIALGWLQDWSGSLGYPSSNNRGANNAYWYQNSGDGTWAFQWVGSWYSLGQLSGFNATPGEENGRVLSVYERDQILSASAIPPAP